MSFSSDFEALGYVVGLNFQLSSPKYPIVVVGSDGVSGARKAAGFVEAEPALSMRFQRVLNQVKGPRYVGGLTTRGGADGTFRFMCPGGSGDTRAPSSDFVAIVLFTGQ